MVQKDCNLSGGAMGVGQQDAGPNNSIVRIPKMKFSDTGDLNEREKHQSSVEWNDTKTSYSNNLCIHELFEAQVEKAPDAVAVIYENYQLTYQELNQRANQLAHYLTGEGVGPDSLVGILLERSFDMVIGILGILKAGGAYVPMDPDYPKLRLEYLLKDANLKIVLTNERYENILKNCESRIICLDKEVSQLAIARPINKITNLTGRHLDASNLAYVIYTSGSTGNPKGVMIEHQSLINRIEWMRDKYGCDSSDLILQKTPFSFDVSVWEFFLPLISGACIVLARPGAHKDPIYISKLVQEKAITKLHFVPPMLKAMLDSVQMNECKSLKQVFCSGEVLQTNYLEMFYQQGITAELHNLYGPTEASIDVSYWACSVDDAARASIPIGKPINNIQLYILDNDLAPVAQGVSGELYIGGVGLARGYWNRPELTAERFIASPFSDDPKNRIYKTGDLCRFLPDGNVEFIGRIDQQVKIRGFRIELGEIENTLIKHDKVRDAVVLSKDLPVEGKCLVAYIMSNVVLGVSELREYLERNLPDYMVPSKFEVLSELPLTPNGKIDRKALTTKDLYAEKIRKQIVEISFLESEVYSVWQHILGYDDIDVDDDLFTIGGDSIAAVQIFSAVNKKFGVNIYVEELFSSEHFSIRWLANLIEKEQIRLLGEEEYSVLLKHIDGLSEEEVAKLLLE